MHTVLRSPSKEVVIGPDHPFCIIGERINPTGRKTFGEQLRNGDLSQVVVDVEELASHGGSLRVYAAHASEGREPSPAVEELVAREEAEGIRNPDRYRRFAREVEESKRALLELLISLSRDGKQIVGYGAPGKGNTLLNYCGIRTDFLDYTVDRNPYKHGRFLPGTHIPIHPPERIAETRPDYVLILPWNLKKEIAAQLEYVREWGGQLVVPIPEPEVLQWS